MLGASRMPSPAPSQHLAGQAGLARCALVPGEGLCVPRAAAERRKPAPSLLAPLPQQSLGRVIYYRPQTAPETTCQETGTEKGARTTGDPENNWTVAGGGDVKVVSKRQGPRGMSPVSPDTLPAEGWD